MRYSEIKPIIEKLHKRGWYKYVGFSPYMKTWTKGDLHYRQPVGVTELFHSAADIDMILNYYENKAGHEFKMYEYAQGGLWK